MVDVTNTEHPRDILLFLDGTWTYREQCGPELLRDGSYRLIPRYSFEWHSRARRASQTALSSGSPTRLATVAK